MFHLESYSIIILFYFSTMNASTEQTRPVVFCLDKLTNSNLKQCFYNFTCRLFIDEKSFLKNLSLSIKTDFIPAGIVLAGDTHLIKNLLSNANLSSIKIFIFCSNSSRQTYEIFMRDTKSSEHLMGLFTTVDDLRYSLEDILLQTQNQRDPIRFITDNLDAYLWYGFLRETSTKIPANVSSKQTIDIPNINRQIEYDPLISLYTHRSLIRTLNERTLSHKKIFYGTVLKKTLIDNLQNNKNNLIAFHSFVQFQGYQRSLDARHQALDMCSRRFDEASVLFEFELANQPTYKVARMFNSNDATNLWIVQLIGTHECVKLIKQFAYLKRTMTNLYLWKQPEILFGSILVEMNEKLVAYRFFFDILINQYDQLNKIYTKAKDLWENEENYQAAIELIAHEYQQVKPMKANQINDEFTYLESEFDSLWEQPIALADNDKIQELLAPISYRMDQVLCSGPIPKTTSTSSANKHRCILL